MHCNGRYYTHNLGNSYDFLSGSGSPVGFRDREGLKPARGGPGAVGILNVTYPDANSQPGRIPMRLSVDGLPDRIGLATTWHAVLPHPRGGAGRGRDDDLERLARALEAGIARLFRESGRTQDKRYKTAPLAGQDREAELPRALAVC